MFALLVPNLLEQVWNKLLTTCNKLDGIISVVTNKVGDCEEAYVSIPKKRKQPSASKRVSTTAVESPFGINQYSLLSVEEVPNNNEEVDDITEAIHVIKPTTRSDGSRTRHT